MNWTHSSKVAALLALTVLFSVVAPVAAVSVGEEEVPDERGVNATYTATFTLDELYKNPDYKQWTLRGDTELQNVTWTVTARDADTDETIDQQSFDGQSFNYTEIDAEDTDTNEVTVEVTGTVPDVENFTYAEKEEFLVATLTQIREGGTTNEIDTWTAHHYTEDSKAARDAIVDAESDVAEAESAGADATQAQETLDNAKAFYENGDFEKAIENAEKAGEQAQEAREQQESSEQTTQMLMYGGIGVVALLVIGGAVYWFQNQGDDYDKLG